MTTELIKIEDLSTDIQEYNDDQFALTSRSGDYLPRLQFMSARSPKCSSGDFPINHYALVNDQQFDDLGTELDVVVVAWRPKALHVGETVITLFNPEKPQFQEIQEKSGLKDNMEDMFGPEFLIWIPHISKFATLFMCSASMRRESPKIKAFLKGQATLSSQYIKTAKFEWHTIKVLPCSTPPQSMPDTEELRKEYLKFITAKDTEVEVVNEGSNSEERAR